MKAEGTSMPWPTRASPSYGKNEQFVVELLLNGEGDLEGNICNADFCHKWKYTVHPRIFWTTPVCLVPCPWSGPVPLNWVAGAASARSCRPDEVLWFLRWHFAHRTLVLTSILFCPHITRLSLQQTASWWTVCWLSLDTQRTQHQALPHRRRQSNNASEEPSDVFGQEDESFSQSNCYLLWGVGGGGS